MIAELRARDPLLFWTGALMVLGLVVVTLLSISDQRLILGINPWIKPMKFLISITIFLWTIAWFMPETQPDLVKRALVRWTIAGAMVDRDRADHHAGRPRHHLALQRRHGVRPRGLQHHGHGHHGQHHRDDAVPVDHPPRHAASRAGYLWGIRLGVALFMLASWQGFLMVANNAHAVPGPDGGPGLPFVNWSIEIGRPAQRALLRHARHAGAAAARLPARPHARRQPAERPRSPPRETW